jgi:hypothetical protein
MVYFRFPQARPQAFFASELAKMDFRLVLVPLESIAYAPLNIKVN